MKLVRFLERKGVIRFFGVSLILAPFINMGLHLTVIKMQGQVAWSQFQFWPAIQSAGYISLMLAACSLVIGSILLSGSQKAWKYVLILVGAYLGVQILNVGSQAWKGPLAWPSFILNASIFFFLLDQLVWKVQPEAKSEQTVPVNTAPIEANSPLTQAPSEVKKTVVNLKSYRKILFSFGSDHPWGELKTLSSERLSVKSIAQVPGNIENKTVQINFAKDVVVDIQFEKQEGELVYFKPLNLDKEKVTNLNRWLKKIAV
ncbi:MAG: hypothetical protein K0R29_1061 [Pseudobdellovibrio sp.]|jgi:hypothetical protein|nr:hypothetical protein [Pseudobdellovibrio sp.]